MQTCVENCAVFSRVWTVLPDLALKVRAACNGGAWESLAQKNGRDEDVGDDLPLRHMSSVLIPQALEKIHLKVISLTSSFVVDEYLFGRF
ncbi:hypothetical protein PoB_007022500 [Plakobranchus ocellatus]|uniref:Uncharacterized protein n=1 Tax=Plakobranchus ocellatus TaxID=259542 RepID=A0AAV4DHW2_9GAST|nr:hypothetical protein PoB_007022500 [Plakobranchus ocellatus]